MKRLLSLLLTLCMLLSLLTVGASAANTRDLADGYYLIGTHNNWDAANFTEADRFHESLGDPAEFVLETTLTQGQQFKVVKVVEGAISAWYPEGNDNNYVVDADHAGPAILYFRDSYYEAWAASGGYVWVGGKPAVSYVDENGETQSCTEYTTANYAGTAWSGWIVVHEDTTLSDFCDFDMDTFEWVNDRIYLSGDVHLILEDACTLTVPYGIHIPEDGSLTIYAQEAGTGALSAGLEEEPMYASIAGIGGNENEEGGELTINGGVISVIGGTEAAGIGGGIGGYLTTITINGGTITAYGAGDCGDGIGAGDSANGCSNIVINGGTVTACGGGSGAGIGCYYDSELVINDGAVTAYGGVSDAGVGAAGIGGNFVNIDAGTITINGGTVNAFGGDGTLNLRGGAGIGGASGGNAGAITINGGVVNAVGGEMGGAGIGPGAKSYVMPFDLGSITITGGQVTASSANAAGIGFSGTFTPNNGDPIPVNTVTSLGWTDETDFILATSYAGTVTLADDWAVDGSDETFEAGTVEDNTALAGKKLVPPAEEPPVPVLDDGYYLIGPDWTVSAVIAGNKFVENPEAPGEYMLTTTLTEGQQIKVVKMENDAIMGYYPEGTNNEYTVDAAHAGQKTVYFKTDYCSDWAAFGGYIWIEANPDEPVEPVETDALHIYSSISVGTDMIIGFTARKADLTNYTDFWIEVVKHDPDGDVSYTYGKDVLFEGSSTWGIQFKKIYAKEMGIDVEARVYAKDADGQVFMSPALTTNIRDYLGGRLTATNNKVEQRVLAADMLNYGAAAQMFMDFQTDHLVNEELTEAQLAKLHEYETTGLPVAEKTNYNTRPEGRSNILFTSVTIGNEVLLGLTINLPQDTGNVQVLVREHKDDGTTGDIVTTLDTTFPNTTFLAAFNGIGADKMRTEYDFVTLVNGVETGNIRTWSLEGYVGEIRTEGIALKVDLGNALLNYGDSAAAYFAAQ